jgi:cyclomaltodextrin glucanotransferase
MLSPQSSSSTGSEPQHKVAAQKNPFITEREFREEIIYFLIVDRFYDATSEEEERRGVWDRGETPGLYDKTWTQWGKYWGGNLLGIIDKIPYLKSLGITAVWLSPLFEQVDDMQFDRAPMHGYWTKDFKRINPRFIPEGESNSIRSSETIHKLVSALHAANIKLILDIVCNHSSPDIKGSKGIVYDDGALLCDFNDDTNCFYHHNPEITDWDDEHQLINGEMLGLATFNENNPAYRNYIKTAICEWLDIGVDALRVDTLKHMPLWFWQEFSADIKRHLPGTFLFGEYGFGKPWDKRTVSYANHSGMSILDFGLADAIRFAFSGQQPGGFNLVDSLLAYDYVYQRANELVTFIDNHDMPRFLSISHSYRSLEQALVLLFALRGVPCLFYGTEQYLVDNTEGGNDPYNRPMMMDWNQDSQCYNLINILITTRRRNQALTFGSHQQLYVSDDVYAFARSYRDHHAICVLNKGPKLTISLDLSGRHGYHQDLTCQLTGGTYSIADEHLQLELESGAAHLFSIPGTRVNGDVVTTFQLNGIETQHGQRIVLTGDCTELGYWDPHNGYGMEYVNQNTWICEVGFSNALGKLIQFKYAVVDESGFVMRECINPRRLVLPSNGREKIDSIWELS